MVFSNESPLLIRWPKYWSFSFSISPSNEYSGLISLRMHWFDLLAVQGTLKSLLWHHNSKALILQHSAFFMVQLSHLYMTTGKTVALTIQTFVSKVMSLLFTMLSSFVIAFLLRSKHLLILWLQSLSTVILEPNKIKSVTVFNFPPSICHGVLGLDAMILVFLMLSFKPAFWLSIFTLIKRLFSSSSLFALREISSAYLKLMMLLPEILIAADSPSLAYKWNKQGDTKQPRCTPFPIWNQFIVPCPVLTLASWPAYKSLRSQVRWSGIPISFRILHSCFAILFSSDRDNYISPSKKYQYIEIIQKN